MTINMNGKKIINGEINVKRFIDQICPGRFNFNDDFSWWSDYYLIILSGFDCHRRYGPRRSQRGSHISTNAADWRRRWETLARDKTYV